MLSDPALTVLRALSLRLQVGRLDVVLLRSIVIRMFRLTYLLGFVSPGLCLLHLFGSNALFFFLATSCRSVILL